MLSTIELDDQLCFHAHEVSHVPGNGHLPPELEACNLTDAKPLPEVALGIGCVVAKITGAAAKLVHVYP